MHVKAGGERRRAVPGAIGSGVGAGGGGWALYAGRLWELTACEWKLREQATLFGFLWTLLQPALMFAVLYNLFTKWLGSRTGDYASYLLIGIVQYGFFNNGSTYGLTSLTRRSGILMNFKIPREMIVFSAVLSVALSYFLELALMAAFILALGSPARAAWAFVPVIVAAQVTLVAGLILAGSVFAAKYSDFERIWSLLITAGFFLTPIFYSLEHLAPSRRRLLAFNPMTHVIEMSRTCLLAGRAPSAAELLGLIAVSAAVFAVGLAFFKSREPDLADYVAV